MKKISLISILLIVMTVQTLATDNRTARVQKIAGVEAYILCQPIRPYEIVKGKGNSIKWGSFITGGLVNASISTKVNKFIKGLHAQAKEEGFEFDAVIYTSGKNIVVIKFTEEPTEQNNRLAKVQEINNVPVFVMNEPIMDYEVETEMGPGVKWKSFLTIGLINNSIEQDMLKFIKKTERNIKKNKVDAIVYDSGKRAIGVKFNSN